MTEVEQAYRQAIDAMTPAQRIARMITMSAWGREVVARIIASESGPLPDDELKWRVALQLYGGDAESRQLIERMLAHVCD